MMRSELTIEECQDRLEVLGFQIEAKEDELVGFNKDVEDLSSQTAKPGASTAERVEFSEKKLDMIRRTKSAISLLTDEMADLKRKKNELDKILEELEAIAALADPIAQLEDSISTAVSNWDEIAKAISGCPRIAELNFPKTATLETVIQRRGLFRVKEIDGLYRVQPSQTEEG